VTQLCASVREKSTARTEVSVSAACHIPELKEKTPSASQTHVVKTKSSHGSVLVLTVKKAHPQTPTEVNALVTVVVDE